MQRKLIEFRSRTALNILRFRFIFHDNQSMLKLPSCQGIHTEIGLQRLREFYPFGNIDKTTSTPHRTVQSRKFMIGRRHELHKVLFDEVRIEFQSLSHIIKENSLL